MTFYLAPIGIAWETAQAAQVINLPSIGEVHLALELSVGSNKEGPTTSDAISSIPTLKNQLNSVPLQRNETTRMVLF